MARRHGVELVPDARWRTGVGAIVFAVMVSLHPLRADSCFTLRPDDPRAVELTPEAFGAHADGKGDDAAALQAAINRVQETTHAGVVLIPEGRYRLGRTVYVWQGIRLIGYGRQRPVFVLGRNTPGFQAGAGRYMVQFCDNRPPPGGPLVDATEFTFYSGMSNIDFELQDGNPAAIAIRFHVAQHSALTHMDFQVGAARAALEDIGNQASDIHVHGGEYGIITKRTAPVWQFLLMDSSFDGQRIAAIHTQEAGMTLIRDRFTAMPVAVEIAPGEVEQLYGQDLRMENIRTAAVAAGNDRNPHSEITLANIACAGVPRFFSGTSPLAGSAENYVVDHFYRGLQIGYDGREQGIQQSCQSHATARPQPAGETDIPALPPMREWVNVHALGVVGDGIADDTTALQAAIDAHRVLYLPTGTYRVSGSLTLKPDTVILGLNPGTTQIALADGSAAFSGAGAPLGVLVAPSGGRNIVSSIAIATGVRNPCAVGVVWMAGPNSLLDDVSFPVRGALARERGRPVRANAAAAPLPANNASTARSAPAAGARGPDYSDTQAADILVTNGGGGIFRGNWAHDTVAKVGLRVENTSTPGRIYQISVEHHLRVEAQFHHVRNWEIYALQTEEENPAGADAYALDIDDSQDLQFANTYMYRVSRNVRPKPFAAIVHRSDGIYFDHVKVFSQTRLAFDNSVLDETSGVMVRPHFFTRFAIDQALKAQALAGWKNRTSLSDHSPMALNNAPPPATTSAIRRRGEIGGVLVVSPEPDSGAAGCFAQGAKLEKLATGFSNASGLAADAAGNVFFTDAVNHRIYRWNETTRKAEVWSEIPGQPMALGFVAPSRLLAVANEKAVYQVNTSEPGPAQLVTETADPLPGTVLLLPVGLHNPLSVLHDLLEHRGYVYRPGSNTAIITVVPDEPRGYYYAPGTSTAILAGGTWRPNLQSSQLARFVPGTPHPLTSEDEGRTYQATLDSNNRTLSTTVVAERGGTAVVADAAGRIYIASGQIWIYDLNGTQLGYLAVPERPGSLAFGGPDRRTLYIGARTSLYAIHTQAPELAEPAAGRR